jgi:uncharacterized membrane protein
MLMKRAIGVFSSYETAETALRELKIQGFLMDRITIVGHDINRQIETTGVNTDSRLVDTSKMNSHDNEAEETARKGAVAGGAVGGLTGLLVGLGAIAIPAIGPVMLAGAAATAIATAISGSAIGAAAGSLAGGLVGLQIPEDRARVYGERVEQGDYLVMVEGLDVDIEMAQAVFTKHNIQEWYIYELQGNATPIITTSL